MLSLTALIKKVYIFILITILMSAGGFASFASAAEVKAAPLNPLFVEWQKKMDTRKTSGSDKTDTDFFATDSSHGYAPSPVDWSHLDNVAYSVINGGSNSNRRGTTLPASYDLRSEMPAVRNQGDFGTCWTFAAMTAAESNLIHDKKILTKDNADLSEWYLAYYGYNNESAELTSFTYDPNKYDPKKEYYDVGGDDWRAVAILARGTGFVEESSAPYPKSTSAVYKPTITARKYKLKNALYLGNLGTEEVRLKDDRKETIKEAIRTYGAVSIGLTCVADADSNVYYNDTTSAYYKHSTEGTKPDHAVTIVGWDDNYSKDNFVATHKPTANGAWIIRNSWGTLYHDKGYYYASYEETSLHDGVAYDTLAAPDKERVYQYDPLGLCNFINYPDINTAYFANIFKASRNEKISSVSFYTSRPDSQGSVKIYKDCGSNPTGGTLVTEQSFALPAPGYNTVDLDSAVAILNYGKFSVVVSISLPDISDKAIPVEYPIAKYSEKATASAGQSFISSDGTTWDDLPTLKDYENANVCIKAFGTLDENPADTGSGGGCTTGPGMIILLTLAIMPLMFTRKKH
ncbi:MAG: lectin like domain-containing protein [Synergistaceae bacterium]